MSASLSASRISVSLSVSMPCCSVTSESSGLQTGQLTASHTAGSTARAAVFRRRKGSRAELIPSTTPASVAGLSVFGGGRPPLSGSASTSSPGGPRANGVHAKAVEGGSVAGGGVAAIPTVLTGNVHTNPLQNGGAAAPSSTAVALPPSSRSVPSLPLTLCAFTPGVHRLLPRLCGVPYVSVVQALKTDELSEEDNAALLASTAPNVLRRSLRTTMLTVLSNFYSGLWAALLAPAVIRAVSAG